jgi:hypothetical protein
MSSHAHINALITEGHLSSLPLDKPLTNASKLSQAFIRQRPVPLI